MRRSNEDRIIGLDVHLEQFCRSDPAANPSVLSGVDGKSNSRQVVEYNLFGTVNLLEYCKRAGAGFILLSTSRVYSIAALAKLPIEVEDRAFQPKLDSISITGISNEGVSEDFSTASPLSLYGGSKLASEILALEYGDAFHFPVWINRCGVLAGAGQFGRPDQGIFAFWINAYFRRRPLKYTGFGGQGHQVRDCLHPRDVAAIVWKQMQSPQRLVERIQNVSGGVLSAMSLAQLSDWCAHRFGNMKSRVTLFRNRDSRSRRGRLYRLGSRTSARGASATECAPRNRGGR